MTEHATSLWSGTQDNNYRDLTMGPHKQARIAGRRTRVATELETGLLFTKILATLGPASGSIDSIESMVAAGARAFRINFSHGTLEEHARTLANVRVASERVGEPIAVVGDLCGPKMRLGQVVDGGVTLAAETRVEFSKTDMLAVAPAEGEAAVFSTTYSDLVDEVQPGQRVLLDDGKISLTCIGHEGDGEECRLLCEVLHGGTVTSRKGINLPDTELSTPALTDRDRECARFAVENGVDFLALSFVRSRADVAQLRELLGQLGVPRAVIAV
jgi:pyruvate kinase